MRFSKSGLVSVLAAAAWLLSAVYLVVDGRRSHVVHASGILALPATVVQTNQSNTYTTGTQNFAAAVHTIPTIVVASTGALPASGCTNGELAIVTSATPGQQIYENSSTGSCTWTQQTGGGGSGGGVITYSGAALTTVSGTIFCPAGGGGTCSGTEANVDLASSSSATITNLSVQLSTALGAGNTVTVTWRKNGASQSSACSISGAVATSCQDTTHGFNVSQGDLVDYQLVFSGTILVNPFLSIMSQFGTTTTSGSVNTGAAGNLGYYAGAGSAISDSLIVAANVVTAGSGAAAAKQVCVAAGASKTCTYIDFPDVKLIPAANCNATVAGAGWSTATANFTAACRAGSNNLGGALQAIPSTGAAAQFLTELSADWDTSTQPYISIFFGSGANTSGTVVWTVSSACSKEDGSVTDDPAFNAEAAFASQTMAVANRMWAQNGQFTAITSGNNCIAGSSLIVKVAVSGTAASNINAYQAVVTVPRRLTVQAN